MYPNQNKINYQKVTNWGLTFRTELSFKVFVAGVIIVVLVGNLKRTWLKKYIARPGRKFLNSKITDPP